MLTMWKSSKLRRRRRKSTSTSSIVILDARPIVAVDRPVDDGGVLIGSNNPVVPLDWYPFKPGEHIAGKKSGTSAAAQHFKKDSVKFDAALHTQKGYRLDPYNLLSGNLVEVDVVGRARPPSCDGDAFTQDDDAASVVEGSDLPLSVKSMETDLTQTMVDDGLTDWGLPKVLAFPGFDDEEIEGGGDGLINSVVNSEEEWDNDQKTSLNSSDGGHDSEALSKGDPLYKENHEHIYTDIDRPNLGERNKATRRKQSADPISSRNLQVRPHRSTESQITDREIELNARHLGLGSASMSTSNSIGSICDIEVQSVEEVTSLQHDSFDDCIDALDLTENTHSQSKHIFRLNSQVRTRLGMFVVIMYVAVFLGRDSRAKAKLLKLYSKPRRIRSGASNSSPSLLSLRGTAASSLQPFFPSRPSTSSGTPRFHLPPSSSFHSLALPSAVSVSGVAQPRTGPQGASGSSSVRPPASSFPDWGV